VYLSVFVSSLSLNIIDFDRRNINIDDSTDTNQVFSSVSSFSMDYDGFPNFDIR